MQWMSVDPITSKERMPTDGVPRQLLILLIELLRSHELPALATCGAWCKVAHCLDGRRCVETSSRSHRMPAREASLLYVLAILYGSENTGCVSRFWRL